MSTIVTDVVFNTQEAVGKIEDLGTVGDKVAAKLNDSFARIDTKPLEQGLKQTADIVPEIGKKLDELVPQLESVSAAGANLGETLEQSAYNFGESIGVFVTKVGVVVGALVAISAAMLPLTKSFATSASKIKEGAIAAGTTTDAFQKLNFVAEQSGASAEVMQRAYAAITAATGRAFDAGSDTAGGFKKLGIALIDANGNARDSAEVFKDVAYIVNSLASRTDRAAASALAFGRRLGPGLTEMLSGGRAEIERLSAEAVKLGLVMSHTGTEIGDTFGDALDKFTASLTAVKNAIGSLFAPGFIAIFDQLSDAVARNTPAFIALATTVGAIVMPILQALASLIAGVILPAISYIIEAFGTVATQINSVFGTSLTGADLLVGLIITKWIGLFGVLLSAIKLVVALVSGVGAAFTAAGAVAVAPFVLIGAAITGLLVLLGYLAYQYWDDIKAAVDATFGAVVRWCQDAIAWVGNLIKKLGELVGIQGKAADSKAGADSGGGVYAEGMAGGGAVRGPGTSTSDSILARLSRGEYVVRAAAVQRYGVGVLDAINRIRLPRDFLRGFNMGGLVAPLEMLMPKAAHFAEGGAVSSRIINLTIGGETFAGLIAPEIVAQKLTRVATKSQVRSTGRKPSWVR